MEQRAAASKVNRQWVLAFALLAFRRALDATDNNRRRQLALGMSGIIAVLSGSLDSQRNQWALLASGLALLGAIKQDPHASAGETLSNLRAERARFCRLLQAHMQLAVRGAQAVMESDAMESITVSASGIASTMFLVNHVERCSRADPAALDPTDTNIGFLECLQSIADVLAARASELEVQMSFALPTPPYSGHQAVEAVFPIDDEIAYMHGNWKLQQEAVQPIRHVFLESACLLLERHLQATDEVCIVPRCSRNSDGCAVVYFVCRRSLRGVADEDSKEALHSTPWSNARLTEILQVCNTTYGERISIESRRVCWADDVLLLGGVGPNGRPAAESEQAISDIESECRGADMAQHNWLFVRISVPGALRPLKPLRSTGNVFTHASALTTPDLAAHSTPLVAPSWVGLGEFRLMLRGARVLTRADARASRKLLSGIEGYLREFGCNVERKVGVSMGTPSTPGTSVQMVAQKPPAFVIIDDDIDLLRTEFEALRGTLTFSSGKGVSGSPLSFQQTQETSTSGGIGIRRRGFAATLGIVVLVPIKSMAEYRDCVRAMTLAPHPLPPPVVRIVPKPISERRLLVSLRAAWYARRTRPSVTGYPLGNQPHPPASPQLVPPSAHLASYDHSTLSTPRSTGSEGMYSNLRTVADVSGVFPEPHVPTLEIPIPVKRKDRKQRPEAIGIVTKNDDMDMDNQAGESPPSPLIRVDPVLAKSMRCATSPREAPVLEPRSDYISRLDTVIEGESDSTGNAATSVIDKAASPVNSPNAEPNNLVATVTADQRRKSQTQADAELHRVDTTESSVSASVLALQTKTSIDLERGAIDSSSISKTRSLLRDKMALFNRAKQKARNKFRGISDAHTADDDDSVSVVPPNRSDTVDSEESLTTLPAEPAVKEEVENTPATHPLNLQPPPLTVTRPSIQIQKSHQSADVDVDKPLPALPAAVQEIESSRESIAATSTDSAPSQTAGSAVPKATAPNAARDRKARLRARLQNASKKLAESQKMAQQPTDGRSENSDASSMKSRERKVLSSSSGGSSGTTKKRISNPQPQPQPQLQSDSVQQQQQQHQGRSAGTANKNGSGNVPPIRVLIVEDNLINRSIMERFLRHMDVYYDVASNGEEAITMWTAAAEEKRQDGASPGNAVEGPYHIVFMDIQMPIMDGITATKHIRGLERQRRIGVWEDKGSVARMAAGGTARSASLRWQPYRANSGGSQAGDTSDQVLSLPVVKSPVIIVALTASSLQSDRHAALAAGCNDFLTKPVSLIWLKKKIMEWGCMQALVDHEGWQRWRTLRENAGAPSQAK